MRAPRRRRICRSLAGQEVGAVEGQPVCASTMPGGGTRREDGAAGGRLARAALADDAELLACRASKLTPRTASDDAGAGRGSGRAGRRTSSSGRGHARLGSSTSRRPSPSRLKPRLTMKMASPGMVATHHCVEDEGAARGDHRAPFRQRRLGAEAEEAQAGGGQDDARHVERQADDQRGQAQRDDVAAR